MWNLLWKIEACKSEGLGLLFRIFPNFGGLNWVLSSELSAHYFFKSWILASFLGTWISFLGVFLGSKMCTPNTHPFCRFSIAQLAKWCGHFRKNDPKEAIIMAPTGPWLWPSEEGECSPLLRLLPRWRGGRPPPNPPPSGGKGGGPPPFDPPLGTRTCVSVAITWTDAEWYWWTDAQIDRSHEQMCSTPTRQSRTWWLKSS